MYLSILIQRTLRVGIPEVEVRYFEVFVAFGEKRRMSDSVSSCNEYACCKEVSSIPNLFISLARSFATGVAYEVYYKYQAAHNV